MKQEKPPLRAKSTSIEAHSLCLTDAIGSPCGMAHVQATAEFPEFEGGGYCRHGATSPGDSPGTQAGP